MFVYDVEDAWFLKGWLLEFLIEPVCREIEQWPGIIGSPYTLSGNADLCIPKRSLHALGKCLSLSDCHLSLRKWLRDMPPSGP